MSILVQIVAIVLLLFFVSTSPSTADIISTKIRSHNRDIILFSEFKYSHFGYVSVAVSSVDISPIPVKSQSPDPSRIGFFLLSHELSQRYDEEFERNPDLCPLDIKFISILFTFQNLSLPPNSSTFNKSYNVTYPGLYSLYFANCNDLSLVNMDVRTELYNTDHDGVTKDYLSADQPQPSVYFNFFLIYLCFLVFWILASIKNWHCVQMIHLLMGVLLVMNMFYFISAAADELDLKVTGTRHQWRIVFYISRFMRDMYFFTVIVLIGAGWCNWRRDLPGCTVIFNMTVVILLQVWATVTFVKVGESGPHNKNWLLDFIERIIFIDIMCCVYVLLHTSCSFVSFRDDTDSSDFVRSFTSLTEVTARHQVFPVLLLVYMMIARGPSLVLMPTAINETITLVFYLAMFYRPFVLDHEDQKRAGFLDHTDDTGV